MAREVRPDLILLDVSLPERSGIELCRQLKAEPRTADIPMLIVTSWPEADRGARAAGCDGFLLKPVPISELWETADRLLARRASNQLG